MRAFHLPPFGSLLCSVTVLRTSANPSRKEALASTGGSSLAKESEYIRISAVWKIMRCLTTEFRAAICPCHVVEQLCDFVSQTYELPEGSSFHAFPRSQAHISLVAFTSGSGPEHVPEVGRVVMRVLYPQPRSIFSGHRCRSRWWAGRGRDVAKFPPAPVCSVYGSVIPVPVPAIKAQLAQTSRRTVPGSSPLDSLLLGGVVAPAVS